MRLELCRITADWMKHATLGINAKIPGVERDVGDAQPPLIADWTPEVGPATLAVFNQADHDWVLDKKAPPASPALYVVCELPIEMVGSAVRVGIRLAVGTAGEDAGIPMPEVKASVNITRAQNLLVRLQHQIANLQPVLDGPVANAVHTMFERQFATEGAHGGAKWDVLSPRTQAWRSVHNRTAMPILQFDRGLWSSLVKRSSPLGYRIADKDSLIVGTSVQYAEKHQLGTATMPARPIVPETVPAEDLSTWSRIIVDYLEQAS